MRSLTFIYRWPGLIEAIAEKPADPREEIDSEGYCDSGVYDLMVDLDPEDKRPYAFMSTNFDQNYPLVIWGLKAKMNDELFDLPQAQAAVVGNPVSAGEDELALADVSSEEAVLDDSTGAAPEQVEPAQTESSAEVSSSMQPEPEAALPQGQASQLPVSGQGQNDSVYYIILSSAICTMFPFSVIPANYTYI